MRVLRQLFSYFFTAVILINYSCSTDEGLEIKSIREFNIYAQDTLNNALVFDMVPTSNGFLIASICGNSRMENKLSGDGRLYLLEIDNSGNVLWEDICQKSLFQSGYPSNLVSVDEPDEFILFWNEFNGKLKSIKLSVGSTPDSSSIKILDCNGCRADEAILFTNKIYTVGISEGINGPNTVINEFNLNLESNRLLSERSFDASRFGGFGINDLNFVSRINNFIHLKSNDQRLLYTGPSNSGMAFSHVGELIPEYIDNNLWISDIVHNQEIPETFALIVQNPETPQGQSIFIPQVDLSGLPGESDLTSQISEARLRFSSLDPDLPQFIIRYSIHQWVIVGTSINGIPSVISFNTETGQIVRTVVGNSNRMNISKVLLSPIGELLISGTTVVNNRFQRPLLIRVASNDIF